MPCFGRGHAVLLVGACAISSPVVGQRPPVLPVEPDGAPPATYANPGEAVALLEEALRRDSLDYELNWRAAIALMDVGKQINPRGRARRTQDSLYRTAVRYARRAVARAPDRAEGHFALAAALGRASETRDVRERLRHAEEILTEARQALALDSLHDGAWHVLGLWHAEVMRLSAPERFIARRLLGAGVFAEANWPDAVEALERAVHLRPTWIFHRLDLASVLLELDRVEEARRQLDAIGALPVIDVLDPKHRRTAEELLERIGEGGGL